MDVELEEETGKYFLIVGGDVREIIVLVTFAETGNRFVFRNGYFNLCMAELVFPRFHFARWSKKLCIRHITKGEDRRKEHYMLYGRRDGFVFVGQCDGSCKNGEIAYLEDFPQKHRGHIQHAMKYL